MQPSVVNTSSTSKGLREMTRALPLCLWAAAQRTKKVQLASATEKMSNSSRVQLQHKVASASMSREEGIHCESGD